MALSSRAESAGDFCTRALPSPRVSKSARRRIRKQRQCLRPATTPYGKRPMFRARDLNLVGWYILFICAHVIAAKDYRPDDEQYVPCLPSLPSTCPLPFLLARKRAQAERRSRPLAPPLPPHPDFRDAHPSQGRR